MTAPVKERGTRRNFPKIPRGEKISHEGEPAVFGSHAETFRPRGRGLQGSPARRSRDAPERPSLLPRRSAAAL